MWFNATSRQSLKRGFEDIADRWNGRRRRFTDANSRMDYVNEVLGERKWLLIFDNYDNPDEFADISTFMPPSHGSILITSRHADTGLLGKVVRISGRDEVEGIELLRHRTEQDLEEPIDQATAISVLQTLGHLPLAIDQAGAYIRQQKLPMHMFLQQYENQKKIVLYQRHVYWDYRKRLNGEKEAETPLGVLTTWELSLQQIESVNMTRSNVEHLLTVAAFLNHVEVSERLFKEYAQRSRPVPEWLRYFKSGGEWDAHGYRKVISKLLTLSLAQGRNHHTGDCYLSLHPMIKDWLQSRIPEADRSVYIKEAIDLLANYIETNVQERSLHEARDILGHLDACLSSYCKLKMASCRLGFGQLRKHGLIFSGFYMNRGRYREAVEGLQAVLEHDIRVYGQKHTLTLRTTKYLADALVHGGQYHKAHDMLSEAFNDSKDVADLEMMHIVSALAMVLTKLDRQAEAERYYGIVLQGYELRKDPAKACEVYLLYERLAEVKLCLGKHGEAEIL